MNRANDRKEFFKVSIQEIAEFAKNQGLKTEFALLAEAKEYRQTLADPKQVNGPSQPDQSQSNAETEFPERLFAMKQ